MYHFFPSFFCLIWRLIMKFTFLPYSRQWTFQPYLKLMTSSPTILLFRKWPNHPVTYLTFTCKTGALENLTIQVRIMFSKIFFIFHYYNTRSLNGIHFSPKNTLRYFELHIFESIWGMMWIKIRAILKSYLQHWIFW